MSLFGHNHRYEPVELVCNDGVWWENQSCAECPAERRSVKLADTPEDEPPAPHPAPCWCPRCMNRKRQLDSSYAPISGE